MQLLVYAYDILVQDFFIVKYCFCKVSNVMSCIRIQFKEEKIHLRFY